MTENTFLEKMRAAGIKPPSTQPGQYYTTCPKCSADRRKKTARCLSVKVADDHAIYHCNHCDWSGGFGNKPSDVDERPSRPLTKGEKVAAARERARKKGDAWRSQFRRY